MKGQGSGDTSCGQKSTLRILKVLHVDVHVTEGMILVSVVCCVC